MLLCVAVVRIRRGYVDAKTRYGLRFVVFVAGSAALVHFVFFFNDTATTEIYTLSLHDALPISSQLVRGEWS